MRSTTDVLAPFRNLLLSRHQVAKQWKREGKHVVGWSCSYTPEELVYAARALPVMVFGETESTRLADVQLPINCCSFVRSCYNTVLKGDYNYLDGFVASNSCDNRNKTFDYWKRHAKIPYIQFINTPRKNTESALNFFLEEVTRFKTSLEKFAGTEISEPMLENAVEVYNGNRQLLRRAYELRRMTPPLISGVEALQIVLSSMVTPKEWHSRLLSHFLGEVSGRSDPPKEGLRLLVSGSVMDTIKLLKMVEALGGNVVADDWCTGSKYFWDPVKSSSDPLRAICKRYLDKAPSSFMFKSKNRFAHTIEMAKQFKAEAAIIFNLKFCDTHLFDAPQLVEELEATGLPVLSLEWEHALSGAAQLKTRIEAFLEMVGGIVA